MPESKTYRVIVSLECYGDDEQEAAHQAMGIVLDPTMVIESITELKGASDVRNTNPAG